MPIGQEYESARLANERRYSQAMAIYDEIIKRYQPSGTFGKAALGQLEAQKGRDIGRETQQMISSGLYGTTTTAGLPTKWEAEVGAPARLRLEDIMMQRLSQAQIGKAGFIERREDVYPDVGAYAGYAGAAAAKPPTAWGKYDPDYMQSLFGGLTGAPGIGGGRATPTAAPAAAPARAPTTPTKITPPPGSPQALWEAGQWEGSRPLEDIMAGVTTTPPTKTAPTTTPTTGKGGTPTIAEYLQEHGLDPTSADPALMGRAKTLQKQWASLYM